MIFPGIRCGEVDSLEALSLTPNYPKIHNMANPKFYRWVSVPADDAYIQVIEFACTRNEHFLWSFCRPKTEFVDLVRHIREDDEAVLALFYIQDFADKTLLEITQGVEIWHHEIVI